jgi:soluble lytic murein transglycosylase-like protein
VLCTAAVPASAQIFTWRDAAGNLILSNKPPGVDAESVRSYAVPAREGAAVGWSAPPGSKAYTDLIDEHARRNNIRQSLVQAVIQVESGFNPFARSPKGAMGLMQLMPDTARALGVRDAYNPAENVRAGVLYLRQLLDRYDNNEALALAAYNAGPGAVDRHGQSVPPYQETKDYMLKVNRIAGTATPAPAPRPIYRSIDIVDGRPIVKYTTQKPNADK